MEMSLLDYLTEFKTLDGYLADCDANGDAPDIDICRMLMSMTFEKIAYYERNTSIKFDGDPFFPVDCVDFVLHARSEKALA